VTNKGRGMSEGTITVNDNLPGGITYVSFSGTGWTCTPGAGNGSVTCTYGSSLAPGASTSFSIRVRISASIQCAVVNIATVFSQTDSDSRNDTARDTTFIDNCTQPPPQPGNPGPSPGSILIYPVYTSDATNPNRENTRICLTNTDQVRPLTVHLFFV